MRLGSTAVAFCFLAINHSHANNNSAFNPEDTFQPTILTQPGGDDFRYIPTYHLLDIEDINGDGYLDLMYFYDGGRGCSRYCYPPPPSLSWAENLRNKSVFGEEYITADNVEATNAIRLSSRSFNTTGTVSYARLADVDNDGDMDLVASLYRWDHPENFNPDPPDDRLSVFYNTGADPLFAEETRLLGNEGLYDISIENLSFREVIDIDADGDNDILFSVRDQGLFWSSNLGGSGAFGPFSDPVQLDVYTGGIYPTDIDSDGDTDFFLTGADRPTLVYRNDRGGQFATSIVGSAKTVFNLQFADLNGDGLTDVVGNEPAPVSTVTYFLSSGSSTLFEFVDGQTIDTTFSDCASTVADINADSLPDIALDCRDEDTYVYINTGSRDEPFPVDGPRVLMSGIPQPTFRRTLSGAGDFNKDGFDDFVSLNYGDQHILLNNQFVSQPMPVIGVSYPDTVYESSGKVDIDFSLSAPQSTPVSVQFGTVADTAVPREDFYGAFNIVEFAPGETQKTVRIGLIDDDAREPDKRFFGRLAFSKGANLSSRLTTIEIQEDPSDVVGAIAVGDGWGRESQGVIEIPITLERELDVPVSFTVATQRRAGGRFATPVVDYIENEQQITIPAGQTSAVFEIRILDDNDNENQEWVLVRLYQVENATITKGWSLGVIDDY